MKLILLEIFHYLLTFIGATGWFLSDFFKNSKRWLLYYILFLIFMLVHWRANDTCFISDLIDYYKNNNKKKSRTINVTDDYYYYTMYFLLTISVIKLYLK